MVCWKRFEVIADKKFVLQGALHWLDKVVFNIVQLYDFSEFGVFLELLDDGVGFLEIVTVLFVDFEIDSQGLDSGGEEGSDRIPRC